MNRHPITRAARAGFVASVLVGLGAAPALAQGTEAEREACTPDAIKLCSDTIPDVAKTTACMKAHRAQLSPRCRAVIVARADRGDERDRPPAVTRRGERYGNGPRADEEGPGERRYQGERRYDEGPRYEEGRRYEDEGGYDGDPRYGGGRRFEEPGERRYLYREPDGAAAEAPSGGDRDRARAEIGRLCDEQMIDPRTCALTDRALR